MSTPVRILILATAGLIIFSVVVAIGLRFMPEPRSETDYLVVGCIATLAALAAVFGVLITTWVRTPELFFKKRPKDD